jgi:hypothetical protein
MKQTTPQKTQVRKKGPHKYTGLKGIKDSYKQYKADYPRSHVDIKTYKKVCLTFFRVSVECLLDGMEVKIPFMGSFKVAKRKRDFNKLQPNWVETKKLWDEDPEAKKNKKLVYHLNEHSKGFYYRFHWRKGMVKNISAYSFLPVRSAKSLLAKAILVNKKDYIG